MQVSKYEPLIFYFSLTVVAWTLCQQRATQASLVVQRGGHLPAQRRYLQVVVLPPRTATTQPTQRQRALTASLPGTERRYRQMMINRTLTDALLLMYDLKLNFRERLGYVGSFSLFVFQDKM